MICAIVLAAGESRRMGMPKPLLRFGDTTFLGRIICVLQECAVDAITVVLGSRAERVCASVDLSSVNVIVNEHYRDGQLSSLIAGLQRVPSEADAILLCLVDNPLITSGVVDRIADTFRRTHSPIVIPTFEGRRGHPTLFGRAVFNELLHAPADQGARHVVHADEERVVEAPVSEQEILVSIDTPGDYFSHFGVQPQVIAGEKP